MKKITKIMNDVLDSELPKKLRVAAYCRVSTDSDEQLGSLDAQIKHYESHIKDNPEWEYAGLYYDEGITGTSKEKRPGLLKMISDCENRRIDFIITKSISRFARNTADCLELVRKLIDLNIFIYFEKENIHTGTMDSELMLSILSGMAAEESNSNAQNQKWSSTKRFQNGSFRISFPPYGYDNVDGKLVVNKQQAQIVKFIFNQVLAGNSSIQVAKQLNDRDVKPSRGGLWRDSTIRAIIKNEKYTGDALFQKTYADCNFKRKINKGELDQYFVANHHDPIISHETFDAVQDVIIQRCKEKNNIDKGPNNTYPFSGKIICSNCGRPFKRRIHRNGKKYVAWCCKTHIQDISKCSMKFIRETEIEHAFVTMINKLVYGNDVLLRPLFNSVKEIGMTNGEARINELNKLISDNSEQRRILGDLFAKNYLDQAVYLKSNNELLNESARLEQQQKSLLRLLNSETEIIDELRSLMKFTNKAMMLSGFDTMLFERFVERIIVYSQEEIAFELKCGIIIKERLVIT